MEECNSHCMYPDLNVNISNDLQFKLIKINEIKNYFTAEIRERELTSKNISKYIASFEYLDKSLIVLSVGTGSNQWTGFYMITASVMKGLSLDMFEAFSLEIFNLKVFSLDIKVKTFNLDIFKLKVPAVDIFCY